MLRSAAMMEVLLIVCLLFSVVHSSDDDLLVEQLQKYSQGKEVNFREQYPPEIALLEDYYTSGSESTTDPGETLTDYTYTAENPIATVGSGEEVYSNAVTQSTLSNDLEGSKVEHIDLDLLDDLPILKIQVAGFDQAHSTTGETMTTTEVTPTGGSGEDDTMYSSAFTISNEINGVNEVEHVNLNEEESLKTTDLPHKGPGVEVLLKKLNDLKVLLEQVRLRTMNKGGQAARRMDSNSISPKRRSKLHDIILN